MKKRMLIVGCAVVALMVGAGAQERVDLTTPIVKTSTQNCQLDELHFSNLSVVANARIDVVLLCNNSDKVTKTYNQHTSPTAASLVTTLNTANNSTTSLIKRVYNRLITDGVITGTVSGSPQ